MTRKRTRIHFLLPLGCLLLIVGLIGLGGTPRIIQYAFLPDETRLGEYADGLSAVESTLGDAAQAVTLHGVKNGIAISTDYSTSESSVTLYQIGPRWNEVYPRVMTEGEALGYAALAGKQRLIVLDSELAFRLFGDRDPIGEAVDLNGERFEVSGVARHQRRLGELNQYAAWVPLGSDEALGCDLMAASVLSGIDTGLMTLFENAAKDAFGEGTLIGLMKERMRAAMILRVIALAVALRLLALWVGVLKRLGGRWLAECRARARTDYLRQMLGFILLRVFAVLLLAAATLAVCRALMDFFVEPVLVFVEWVPEVLVSFASIKARFWELAGTAARPVSLVTAELAELRFWANLLRWGVIFALTGGVMTALNSRFPKENGAER